jgi:hypothetical protein
VRAPALVLMHALIWGRGSRTQPSRLGSLNRCGAGTSISTNLLQNQCLLNELRIGLRFMQFHTVQHSFFIGGYGAFIYLTLR